jgi:Rab GDP dissociation inhibitor
MVSSAHAVCAKGLYVAIVSTTVETKNPEAELQPGFDLLGEILEQFTSVTDLMVPLHDGTRNKLFVTSSYDATSHFESASDDVMQIYKRIMGEELDLTVLPEQEEQD